MTEMFKYFVDENNVVCHFSKPRRSPTPIQPAQCCARRGIQDEEKQEYLPQVVKMHIKGVIPISPDSCIF